MKIIKNKYLCFIASFVLACGVAFALPSGEDMDIYNKVKTVKTETSHVEAVHPAHLPVMPNI